MDKTLNREIIRLSIPSILSNITIPLLGLTDTVITGHLGSPVFIAAIAIGTLMFNTVFWLFGFLRMGTTGLTAQAYGAGDTDLCNTLLSRSFFLGFALGMALTLLQWPTRELLLWLIAPGDDIASLAIDYYSVCIWGAPALLGYLSVMGWMIGMQNTAIPMVLSISTNILNIVLSILFVFPLGMGFIGVAYGSLAANWTGLALALLLQRIHWKGAFKISIVSIKSTSGYSRFFRVNADIFFRSACILYVSMSCGALGARIGTLVVATNAVLMNFYHFFSYFMDGFAFTGEALTGRYFGAQNLTMLRKSVKYLLLWGGGCAAIFFCIYLFLGSDIVGAITNDADVRAYASTLKTFIILLPPLTVLAFMFDGFFIGLTATRRMLAVTLASAIAFSFIVYCHPFGDSPLWGIPTNENLWTAFLIYLFLRGALLAVQWPSLIRKPHI